MLSNERRRKRGARLYLFKRDSFRAAGDVNDAAAGEAVFQNDVLHDRVVAVGVDAQVRGRLFAIGDDPAEQAVNLPVAGDSVNRAIGRIGKPRPAR